MDKPKAGECGERLPPLAGSILPASRANTRDSGRVARGGANHDESLPCEVLKTCFLDGAKLWQAAQQLGISERQMTRERSRAIRLLQAELEAPAPETGPRYRPEPIPAILGFLARPGAGRKLRKALAENRLVRVHGPAGVGKTSLVAELAAEASERTPSLWYRFRPGVNDSAGALLFELGEYLRSRRRPDLATYVAEALPSFDPALATRLALKGLGGSPHLLVLDDYHLVDDDQANLRPGGGGGCPAA